MPLLGLDWLREFSWTKQSIESTTKTNDQSVKDGILTNIKRYSERTDDKRQRA